MTELEMKLLILRYNMLSKKRAIAAFTWKHAGENAHDEAEWSECVSEMREMMDDLYKDGYKFTCAGSREAGRVIYEIYKIVPVINC